MAALLTEAEEELAEEMAESIAGQVETDATIAEEPPVLDETGAVIDVSVEVPMPNVAESEDAGNELDAAAIDGDSSTDDGPAAEEALMALGPRPRERGVASHRAYGRERTSR